LSGFAHIFLDFCTEPIHNLHPGVNNRLGSNRPMPSDVDMPGSSRPMFYDVNLPGSNRPMQAEEPDGVVDI